jgi:uncharacterized protein YdcH (DUF465 family)
MFPEYADLMSRLTASNRQFASLLDKHKELDRTLQAMDSGALPATREEIEALKKKKLGYKDRIYNRLREHSSAAKTTG